MREQIPRGFVSRVALLALPIKLHPFWRHCRGGALDAAFSPHSQVSER